MLYVNQLIFLEFIVSVCVCISFGHMCEKID